MHRMLGGVVLLLTAGSAFAQGAPFCVVYSGGQMCNYYDAGACWSTARSLQGMCAPNTQAQQPVIAPAPIYSPAPRPVVQPQQGSVFDAFMRGGQAGADTRLRRAQAEQIEMQTEALRRQSAQAQRAETNDGYWVGYKCRDAAGVLQPSAVPAVGCIVDFVTAY